MIQYTLNRQYIDYTIWENSLKEKENYNEAENYWLNSLKGNLPTLDLESDFSNPNERSFVGEVIESTLSEEMISGLKKLAAQNNTTLHMVSMAAYNLLLAKHTGQRDILIGIPFTLRQHPETQKMVGMFANTLVMRNFPEPDKTVQQFIHEVKANAINAYKYGFYPFEELVNKVDTNHMPNRNPIFQTMFSMDEVGNDRLNLEKLSVKKVEPESILSKFDLSVNIIDYGKDMLCKFQYSSELFSADRVTMMSQHFKEIIKQFVNSSNRLIKDLDITTEDEKDRLHSFSETASISNENTIHTEFKKVAKRNKNIIAIEDENKQITYEELNIKSNKVAQYLISIGVNKEDRIAILMDKSVEMIVSMLGVLKAGCAYIPLSKEFPIDRLNYILEDSDASFCIQNSLEREQPQFNIKKNVKIIDFNQMMENYKHHIKCPEVTNRNLAYIIYTSGTTGKPKGVMIEHKGIPNLVSSFNDIFNLAPGERFLLFAKPVFDTSVGEIWTALLTGASLIIPSDEVIFNYTRFEEFVYNNDIVGMILPPTYLKYLKTDKFSKVRKIVVGGSLSTPELANRWGDKFINAYGPTEATVTSTLCTEMDMGKKYPMVPIGKPVKNAKIYILDENLNQVPIGVRGTIFIGGKGVARGYINREKLTSEVFINNPSKVDEILYNTGDLGKWLNDGNIQFLGRKDTQVKIRGYRIELGEIESVLLEHDQIQNSAVHYWNENDVQALCAYIVAEEDSNNLVEELFTLLNNKLPNYMVPQEIFVIDELPLTTSDKLDITKLPKPSLNSQLSEVVSPKNYQEEKILEIWNSILSVEVTSVETNFFDLGGNSLLGIKVISEVEDTLGVKLNIRTIFDNPTVRELASCIVVNDKEYQIEELKEENKKLLYKTSHTQKRMFILQEMEKGSVNYNMPMAFKINGDIDLTRLEKAFEEVVQRHEVLRTNFMLVDGEVKQFIRTNNNHKFSIRKHKEKDIQTSSLTKFIKPFNLSEDSLIRLHIIQKSNKENIVFVDMHHIISDGISTNILFTEISKIYAGEQLSSNYTQYKEYAEWENEAINSNEKYNKDEEFWLNELKGELPLLDLPKVPDKKDRSAEKGGVEKLLISQGLSEKLEKMANENNSTIYILLLAAYFILLFKYTDQSRLLIGTPTSGRNHKSVENSLGMFVNTVVMQGLPEKNMEFKDYLKEIRDTALNAYEHADYPFDALVKQLGVDRYTDKNPLFQTMFLLQNGTNNFNLGQANITAVDLDHSMLKVDLSLIVTNTENGLNCSFNYSKTLFSQAFIKRALKHYKKILETIVQDPEVLLKDIEITLNSEKKKILDEFNATDTPLDNVQNINELFARECEKNGDLTIIESDSNKLNYSEMDGKIYALTKVLLDHKIKKGDVVAVFNERSIETVIAILAIWRIGAVCLPVNISLPHKRIKFMLKDSNTKALLYKTSEKPTFASDIATSIELNDQVFTNGSLKKVTLSEVSLDDYAYIVYTSGTTGKPKGVIFDHAGLINLTVQFGDKLTNTKQRVAQFCNLSFDGVVSELVNSIFIGNPLIIVPDNIIYDLQKFTKYINEKEITTIQLPPSYLKYLDREKFETLKILLAVGSETPKYLYEKWRDIYMNGYGPSEATVVATMFMPEKNEQTEYVPIGKPVGNKKVYILNDEHNLQPINVYGRIFIAGKGLSRGYLNNSKLTNEKFVKDPFADEGYMYDTGDIGRYREDGQIEYLGRKDFQVKVRGQRLELQEIENVCLSYSSIKDVAVLPKIKEDEVSVIGYYVADEQLDKGNIRIYLSEHLPKYMIPTQLVQVEKIPYNSNGKVDCQGLLEVKIKGKNSVGSVVWSPTEKSVLEEWKKVLIDTEDIEPNSNFFEIGGDSLKMIQLISLLNQKFDLNIIPNMFYNYQTIRDFSKLISSSKISDSQIYASKLKQDESSKSIVFCFPPITGLGSVYEDLVRELSDISMDVFSFDYITHKDKLMMYVNEILELSTNKEEINIIGYSAGCPLAFEVIKILESQGLSISKFVCIDGKPQRKKDLLDEEQRIKYVEKTIETLYENSREISSISIDDFGKQIDSAYSFLNRLLTKGDIDAEIHMITSKENKSYKDVWKHHTKNLYLVYESNIKHNEMLQGENAIELADLLSAILNDHNT
ncbi:amino acid adenylation domain-containing protein [Marinilactibacillus psychrotolerans]|uniref:amino acid adenylation domain-containing protein n=1 Tax=Marinilactibacillus psychrotolerans TaxID=191770 RepID=UPI003886B9FC